MQIPLLYK
uniref:Uncharacterized protein n=1 Tax=Arundo donax TaxID=35708 RepID=A0A0A8ZUX7_ARUDO